MTKTAAIQTTHHDDILVAAANRFAAPRANALRRAATLDTQITRIQKLLNRDEQLLASKRNISSTIRGLLNARITERTVQLAVLRADRDAAVSVASQLTTLINQQQEASK